MEKFDNEINDLNKKVTYIEELVRTKYQRIVEVDRLIKGTYKRVCDEFLNKEDYRSLSSRMEREIRDDLEAKDNDLQIQHEQSREIQQKLQEQVNTKADCVNLTKLQQYV